jgi:hypothetical protein
MNKRSFSPPEHFSERTESKQVIESTTCEASDIKAQDGTIAEMDKKGFSYIDSTMIYGGTIVMRFKKR